VSGILLPNLKAGRRHTGNGVRGALKDILYSLRFFIAIVVLPTMVAAVYYGLIASNQYESSTDFVVRRAESSGASANVGQLLGFSLGSSASTSDALVVQQYLLSHDAVQKLRKESDLVSVFRRPGTDLLSRLWFDDPSPEQLLKFYRRQITISQDDVSGISHLTMHSFRPEDSYALTHKLLQMGEQQINTINQRTYNDQVASAQREVDSANSQLLDIQQKLTSYRRTNDDIDPADSGKAQVTMVTGLTANLVAARARLQAMSGVIAADSPQYQAMLHQVRALEAQVHAQSAKIAGPNQSVATRLSAYEELSIKREQIAKVYAAAAAQLEASKAEAKRKQLYLILIDEPNMPVKSEFPKRAETVLTIFASLFVAYAIFWLLWAGVKEHSL